MKTFDDILSDLMTAVVARTPFTNLNVGAGLRGILEAIAQGIAGLYELVRTVSGGLYVTTATGTWLDLRAREVGMQRLAGRAARLRLSFYRNTPATGDILIPAGTIVRSKKDTLGRSVRFVTEADGTLLEGGDAVTIVAAAEAVGTQGNVGPKTVTQIVTPISGIDGVTNEDDGPDLYLVTEGADPETDLALRERTIAKWDTLGVGGNRTAYHQWAMSVAGVQAAMVLDDAPYGPGTVGVVVLGTAGTPTPELLLEVKEYIRPRQPLTAVVEVTGAVVTEVPLSLLVTVLANADRDTVNANVEAALVAFGNALQLGESLVLARLVAAVMAVDGVYNAQFSLPAEDRAAAPAEYLNIGTITIVNEVKRRSYLDTAISGTGGETGEIPVIDQSRWTL